MSRGPVEYSEEQVALLAWEAEPFEDDPIATALMVHARAALRKRARGINGVSVNLTHWARVWGMPEQRLQAAAWRIGQASIIGFDADAMGIFTRDSGA